MVVKGFTERGAANGGSFLGGSSRRDRHEFLARDKEVPSLAVTACCEQAVGQLTVRLMQVEIDAADLALW